MTLAPFPRPEVGLATITTRMWGASASDARLGREVDLGLHAKLRADVDQLLVAALEDLARLRGEVLGRGHERVLLGSRRLVDLLHEHAHPGVQAEPLGHEPLG